MNHFSDNIAFLQKVESLSAGIATEEVKAHDPDSPIVLFQLCGQLGLKQNAFWCVL